MKVFVICVTLALICYASSSAVPEAVYDGPVFEMVPVSETKEMEAPVRARRVTCDVLSIQSQWISINHSACATKCLFQGRRGGRCNNGVCVCRRG